MIRVAVVDTGTGNLRSVQKALETVGAAATITSDPEAITAADKVVVPGQGHFGSCVQGLDARGGALRQAVLDAVAAGTPFLGICLGLQVLFETSDESPGYRGLGLFEGHVARFDIEAPLKVPHMGWNSCTRGAAQSPLLGTLPDPVALYFVHSFYCVPARDEEVALHATHGIRFAAAVARDNIFACQFHPEKSQAAGLILLSAFLQNL